MTETVSPLRTARDARGWTLDDLAEKAHTSRQTVWRLEKGLVRPRKTTAWALSGALMTPVDLLFPER